MNRSRGFTLVELLVVIGILSLLATILVPTFARAREITRRGVCSTNLHALGRAALMYAGENIEHRLPYVAATDNAPICRAGFRPTQEHLSASDRSVSRAWFVLVHEGHARPQMFWCPSDREVDRPKFETDKYYDWPALSNSQHPFSYSFQVSVLRRIDARTFVGIAITVEAPESVVIAADHNGLLEWQKSGGDWRSVRNGVSLADSPTNNSANHAREMQNVLRLSGNVSPETSSLCGYDYDNIWTRASGSPLGSGPAPIGGRPRDEEDSLLLP